MSAGESKWCEPCRSYHPAARDHAHRLELKCRAAFLHEPSFMVAGNRLPTPDRRREFKCPECGEVVVRLANPLMGKRLVCRGTPRKEVVRG